MEMSFRKLPENQHEIVVRDRKGPDVRLPAQLVGPTRPHDLVHAVVETALGIEDGFWGPQREEPPSRGSSSSLPAGTGARA
ncbi:hypothetical protein ACFTWR_32535 [Streptomyces nigra]|uniref:hypothetical protein n=1 Tax=Streptomyces nigra TaxID=1827580 RepID=UPI0036354F53